MPAEHRLRASGAVLRAGSRMMTMRGHGMRSSCICFLFVCLFVGWLVGWLVGFLNSYTGLTFKMKQSFSRLFL